MPQRGIDVNGILKRTKSMNEFSASLSSNFRIAIAHERISLDYIFLALPKAVGLVPTCKVSLVGRDSIRIQE